MNLILTPIYKSFDIVERMAKAIEDLTVLPYKHILIDDDSGEELAIKPTKNRTIISVKRDFEGEIHKNGEANNIQLGYDYAHYAFHNEKSHEDIQNVFIIESDVIVLEKGWDAEQIDLIKKAPDNWGTIDVQSVDETGKVTYPCTVSPRHDEYSNENFEWIYYPDWQCTLFNKELFNKGLKFNNVPSHYDILFGRQMEKMGYFAYRSKELKALHVNGGGNSRKFIV